MSEEARLKQFMTALPNDITEKEFLQFSLICMDQGARFLSGGYDSYHNSGHGSMGQLYIMYEDLAKLISDEEDNS